MDIRNFSKSEYDQLFIRIEDDGVGMTASKVEELNIY